MNANHDAVIKQYYHVADKLMDAEKFGELFNEDGSFVMGNNPPSMGRKQIQASAQSTFDSVQSLHHSVDRVMSVDEKTLIHEGTVTFNMKDGNVLAPIPFATIFELDPSNLTTIQCARAYADLSPFMAARVTEH